ncbi:MAG: flagellar biosynthetic protein FliO [Alphaproteobacteria bacterium]|nr:flagellar biosynthetic protein FliO [Alphaproteobacteria bacterium]
MDDPTQYLRFAAALIFVLALIGAMAFVARAFGFLVTPQRKPGERRLSIIEMLSLDPRRRLVLVRRDNKEYLILLSSTGETVLEGGIEANDIPDAPMSGSTFVTIKTEPRL